MEAQQPRGKEVPFSVDNGLKCRCYECGVQEGKSCPTDKMTALGGMAGMQAMQEMPSPEEVPLVYCSQGVASCDDLDYSRTCICPSCSVWQENSLQQLKYCRDGDASMRG